MHAHIARRFQIGDFLALGSLCVERLPSVEQKIHGRASAISGCGKIPATTLSRRSQRGSVLPNLDHGRSNWASRDAGAACHRGAECEQRS